MHEQKPSKCRMYWKGILVKIKVGCSREKKQSVNRTGSCALPVPPPPALNGPTPPASAACFVTLSPVPTGPLASLPSCPWSAGAAHAGGAISLSLSL